MWSYSLYNMFSIFLSFFICLKFCPHCISILLAHIWILHKIIGRMAPFLERFKIFCLKSKYPNRAHIENSYLWNEIQNIPVTDLKSPISLLQICSSTSTPVSLEELAESSLGSRDFLRFKTLAFFATWKNTLCDTHVSFFIVFLLLL